MFELAADIFPPDGFHLHLFGDFRRMDIIKGKSHFKLVIFFYGALAHGFKADTAH